MKFSVCLPTGLEGVMYPIPFVEPGDFVRLGQACERLGYDSAWANDHITTQHYVRRLFPATPAPKRPRGPTGRPSTMTV